MQHDHSNSTTDFGFENIPWDEKENRVKRVFQSVASQYDVMNDVMSFGIHRLWKKALIARSAVRTGQSVLDVAGGTGDISISLAKLVGRTGVCVVLDINEAMLQLGRQKLLDQGLCYADYVQGNAEALPFKSNTFQCVTIAFGLRNVTDKSAALRSMYRVLKPGGRLLILEFSKVTHPIFRKGYDFYSFSILPKLGQWIANDAESYRYLAESIRMHPDQETLKLMMLDAGFDAVTYYPMTAGVVTLHCGMKY
ncbi:MAG: bifunctional demethylmenaquinone methyltransferase/2-methoxy-6-polyprenyl-1,4-benzoquinol methylase UbiE [Endozoicomonadaceae bacterium]|nr:bifunctional demethylmenaquinone methyltransferase/2-methoxy-6-polyprenyl-1,4-benzoquinol methylase UbiE [Endozoicomonadaceae bacterium]MBE8232524.1 bifunctional demethylmenaquinone methyltransferase/2-methoxy-6-polyprenyl-1,4-benzoquinol methylase UbiE [Endozoicomonadaceae bacterium]